MSFNQKLLPILPGLICLSCLAYPVLKLFSTPFDSHYFATVEQRDPNPFPKRTYLDAWFRKRNYSQLDEFIGDRLPFRGIAIQSQVALAKNILGESRFPTVDIGKQGWLYYRMSYGGEGIGDGDRFDKERVNYALESLNLFVDWQTQKGRQVRVLIAPNKHTIYPEYLSQQGKQDIANTQAASQLMYQAFQSPNSPALVNLWHLYREEKQRSPHLLYFPEDTHHSSWGGITLIRSLIQSLAPNLWNPEAVKQQSNTYWGSDLKQVLGYSVAKPDVGLPVFYIDRPGVITQSISTENTQFSSFREVDQWLENGDRDQRLKRLTFIQQVQPDHEETLIPGRTLIIRDSFLGTSQQANLAQYFEQVDYLHANAVSQEILQNSVNTYDRIIITVVERNSLSLLEKLPRYPGSPDAKNKRLVFNQEQGFSEEIIDASDKTNLQISREGFSISSRKSKPYLKFKDLRLKSDHAYELKLSMDSSKAGRVTLYYRSNYQPDSQKQKFSESHRISFDLKEGKNDLSFLVQSAELRSPWKLQFEPSETPYRIKTLELFELSP